MTLPTYRNERLDRGESLEGLGGWWLLTPRWWGVLAVALGLGVAYAVALAEGWLGHG
jgi:hypothetical protein